MISSNPIEIFSHIEDVGVRWNYKSYGVERIEVITRARGRYDITRRQNQHRGQRLVLFDNYTHRPISGFIVDISPINDYLIKYIAAGPGWRLYDLYGPSDTSYTETTTTNTIVQNVLDDDTKIVNDDFSDIDSTSTQLGGWQHTHLRGDYPGDIIDQMLKMGDSSGAIWDFYLQDEPLAGGKLNAFKPYLKDRSARTTVDWEVRIKDLSDLTLNSSIRDYRAVAVVWYGGDQGTATGGSATTLVDSGASFQDGSYAPGDEVWNITDGCRSRVTAVTSNTTLTLGTLSGGSANQFASSDKYAIKRKTLWNHDDTSAAASDPYPRYIAEHYPFMDSTQAGQYGQALIDQYSNPVQTAAFTIGSPWVLGPTGRVPLWHMIMLNGGTIRIVDLHPDTSTAQNAYSSFFITALDYGYRRNVMRVAIDTPDRRFDAILKQKGILSTELISK